MGRPTVQPSVPQSGQIQYLEVCNFKSYKGTHTVGPFLDFTAIIGPNGCGKSNLMDAISFVLGVTDKLRGQLRELLYTSGPNDQDRPQEGYVKLVFKKNDGNILNFQRSIRSSVPGDEAEARYTSVCKLNEQEITRGDYLDRLFELGVVVKARNFLVFQGENDTFARQNQRVKSVGLGNTSMTKPPLPESGK